MLGENTIVSFESPHSLQDICITDADARAQPVDEKTFNVRMVNSHGLREAASVLIKRMYSWRGYDVEDNEEAEVEPNRMTLVTDTGGQTVATMTLCFDSEVGLPADENFKDKLDVLRAQGSVLCEPSRLAIDTHVPKRVFASMIHISYIYAHNIHGYTDYVIEVNPRHAVFYKKMLGFSEIGPERMCTRVNAPAVLLRLNLDYMGKQIEKFGGLMEQGGKERSYYPYFFSKQDEPGITERLIGKPN
jgi:hypothetical protein